MIFAPKTATLVANVQNTLVWSGTDFQKSVGYAQPEKPISMTFSVQNNTAQVCYIAISYQTRDVTYNINDRRSIAGIPANTTMRISSNSAAELASLGPNLVSVTIYFISAGAGTVVVSAEAFDAGTSPGSVGSGQNIGLDQRSVQDYVIIRVLNAAALAGGASQFRSYTVPAGKRADIELFSARIDPTPFGDDDSEVQIANSNAAGFQYILRSKQFEQATADFSGGLGSMQEGDVLSSNIINNNPNAAVVKILYSIITLKEYFS
jgi:hypothetical protein